ncbi:MAG: endonuclease MutS2 [Clostridia bacterium]
MDKNLKVLELDKILNMLANETSCDDAKELALKLEPAKTLHEAETLLEETDAAYVLMAKFGAPSFYGLKNASNALRRSQAGGVLSLIDLLRIDTVLKSIRGITQWRSKSAGIENVLDDRFSVLQPNKYLEDRINSTVQNEEEVSDTASPALADIRRKKRQAALKVKDQLDKMTRSSQYQKYLQESLVTQRDGRYVVPVKAEHRGNIPGLVHDSSASGATLFIEPIAVVEANNQIRVLEAKEKDEIERILTVLSMEVGEFAQSIIESYNVVIQLNLIFAKSQLAYKMKAIKPKIAMDAKVKLERARHPLIDPKAIVPTDIELGFGFDSLIITGPNTGGKTISIKTIGLMCVMAMCGMMIPAGEQSKVAFFKNILVDIGDEQSIEQSLSTFSSHMTNIISILDKCDDNTLVLLDELGAGTDPVEGAALATAIIEEIRLRGAKLCATTHYAELKEYAINTKGVENACCEFDVATLSPTYKLLIGMPGKSNAFAISSRLGMDDSIVKRAAMLVSIEDTKFETVIAKLEESRKQLETEKEELKSQKEKTEKALIEANKLKEQAQKNANAEIEQAKMQTRDIIAKTRAQADAFIDELAAIKKKNALSPEDKARLRAGIKNMENSADPVREKAKEDYKLPRPLKVGDDVLIFDIDKKATVLSINKEQVLVQAGIIQTRVKLSNLRLITEKKSTSKKTSGHRTVTKSFNAEPASMSLDIRGENCEDGIMNLDNFIDRALRQNLTQITIIHGKGTGVLRAAVQMHLKRHASIKSYRVGTYGEGEMGVTIAELK